MKNRVVWPGPKEDFFSVQFTENYCKLHVCCSIVIYNGVQCQDRFELQLGKLKLHITRVSCLLQFGRTVS